MKKTVPWNWIVTSFVLAFFGLIMFGVSRSGAYLGGDNNLTILQDTIKKKNEYILTLQDTLEKKSEDIIALQQMLKKMESGNQNSVSDKNSLNSLNKLIKEKDAEIRRQKNEINQLKEKIEFLNSL